MDNEVALAAQGEVLPPIVSTPGIETLIATAIERAASVEVLERLLDMRERLMVEQARDAFFEALSAFQADCPIIPKTKTARVETQKGSYAYHYAPLEGIVSAVSSILRAHGFSYRFDTRFEADPPAQVVTCIVHHRQGHSEASEFRTPVDAGARMNDMQKSASAQTYAKRYAFCNAFGILTGDEDNDGQAPQQQPRRAPVSTNPEFHARAIESLARAAEDVSGPQTGTPKVVGKKLVRIGGQNPLEKLAAEAGITQESAAAALRKEVVEMAMLVEVNERIARGQQDLTSEEIVEPIARDRCNDTLRKLYEKTLDTATATELEALRRVINRAIVKQNEEAKAS